MLSTKYIFQNSIITSQGANTTNGLEMSKFNYKKIVHGIKNEKET